MPLPFLPFLPDAAIYHLANPMPAWVLLWVVPHWKWTPRIVQTIAMAIAALSVALTVQKMVDYGGFPAAEQASLAGVARFLSDEGWAMPTMAHIIATDLWIACWLRADAAACGVRRGPLLLLLLLAFYPGGAAGLLAHLALVRPLCGARRGGADGASRLAGGAGAAPNGASGPKGGACTALDSGAAS